MNRRIVLVVAALGCGPPAGYGGVSERFPTGSPEIAADGLVAAFDMSSTTPEGLLRDFSGGGRHGRLTRTDLTDGPLNRARLFRTVADRVDLPEDPAFDLDGPLTMAAWVRVDSLGLHQHIFACDDKFALWVTPDDQFRLGDTQGSGYSSPPGSIERGRWYAVAAVLTGTRGDSLTPDKVAMYLDGQAVRGVADPTWSSTVLHPSDACDLGFESHQGNVRHQTLPFVGAVEDILLFARAWSDDEVLAHARRPGS